MDNELFGKLSDLQALGYVLGCLACDQRKNKISEMDSYYEKAINEKKAEILALQYEILKEFENKGK